MEREDHIDVKSTIFWDITPCNPLKVDRRFGGTYPLYLQVEDEGGIFLRNLVPHIPHYTTVS
jgi:hypothetical protein